jgi:hypothetical protein
MITRDHDYKITKKLKPFLLSKRLSQRRCAAQVRDIAKKLQVPFASTAESALEIIKAQRRGARETRELTRNGEAKFCPARIWRNSNPDRAKSEPPTRNFPAYA